MNETGIRSKELKGSTVRLPIVRGLQLTDAGSSHPGSTVTFSKAFRKLLANMRNPDNLEFPVPVKYI